MADKDNNRNAEPQRPNPSGVTHTQESRKVWAERIRRLRESLK